MGVQGQGGPDVGLRAGLCCMGWLLGVAAQLQQPALWHAHVVGGLAGAGLVGMLLAWRWRNSWVGALVLAGALAALGFASTSQRAAWRLQDALPAALEGQDLQVTGVIAQMPRVGESGARFVFELESAQHRGQPVRVPQLLSLGWYRGFDSDPTANGPPADLGAGQRWQFTVRLKQPHGSLNPHSFDLELWLFEQGLRAGGSVREARRQSPSEAPRKLADAVGHPVERARQAVRDAILHRVPDRTAAGVLAALVIGDQAAITRDDWDLFRTTGVAHLMSVKRTGCNGFDDNLSLKDRTLERYPEGHLLHAL